MRVTFSLFLIAHASTFGQTVAEWPVYGGDLGGTRCSPLRDITPENVAKLQPSWIYRTGDLDRSDSFRKEAAFECTPIMVDGVLYVTTPSCRVIALDAETGAKRWEFDPAVDAEKDYSEFTNRGVALWTDSSQRPSDSAYRSLYLGTLDARLICIDAATGTPCADFGSAGTIDLKQGIHMRSRTDYQVTSPPAIIGDRVIIGSSMGDNRRADVEEGVVRCFDARSGALLWSWDPIPRRDDAPFADTWRGERARQTGASNVWSIISVDPERDLVFLPTTSPGPDHFGGERLGSNVYGNSVVAIHASTGQVAWHFQVVHHDLWDYDIPCEPVLSTIRKDGRVSPVVIQGTKIGHVFVLDRETGGPIFPVEERAVPTSDVPGEESSPTQPFPTFPPPLIRDLEMPFGPWDGVGELDSETRDQISGLRYEGRFTPPSLGGTLQFPGTAGGMNWGGLSYDPERNIMVANMNRFAHVVKLVPRGEFSPVANELLGLRGESAIQFGTDYGMVRRVFSLNGLPATPPPWGVLVAVNLDTQKVLWEKPLGYVRDDLKDNDWGSPMIGGNCVTASGLIFVAATRDGNFRAIETETGVLRWEYLLPVPAQSTPMTYRATPNGKQYVVICAGGHGKSGTTQGDYVMAFALP